ncbi:MAG: ApbE family lipoprotein [Oscillospiraceae bacterium]|nr:ApbE family lipoprotein [Oscillospiraceae bacterium]
MQRKKVFNWLITILILLVIFGVSLGITLLLSKEPPPPTTKVVQGVNKQDTLMDTLLTQLVYSEDGKVITEKVTKLLATLEDHTSLYKSQSDISKINSNAGLSEVKPIKVNSDTFYLIKKAKEYSKQSDGLFDISIAPITILWGITSEHPTVPSEEQIKEKLSLVNYKKITIDEKNKAVKLTAPYMALDLGAIAKGYACDLIRDEYEKSGVSSALTSFGGSSILSMGTKPDGSDFSIGIRDPFGGSNDTAGTLIARNKIVSTSGAYERYFEKDGKRYHHIFDPRTGYPAESGLSSVTVISDSGILTDYLSTALFIGGKEAVIKQLNNDDYSVIAIDNEKNVYISDKIKSNFTVASDKGFKLV